MQFDLFRIYFDFLIKGDFIMSKKRISKHWHVIFSDVRDFEIFDDLDPAEILDVVCDTWCSFPGRSAMCYFCISTSGVYHLHCYFSSKGNVSDAIYKLFPGTIVEPLNCSLHTFILFMIRSGEEVLDYSVGVSEDVI